MPVQSTLLNYYNEVEDSYVLIRSELFYYLKFINYDKDLFKDASKLTSKPTVVFYTENSTSKVILDYTTANETDKKYLYSFFANITQTDTITLSSGDYLDPSELSADISGTFVFTEFKDNKLFATVSSVTNQNTALDVYFGDYFIEAPQLSKSGNLGSSGLTENYALVSVNPKTKVPLTSMGILPGDLIEIIKSGSANNQIKYEVLKVSIINEKEVIQVKPYNNSAIPTQESLIGSAVILNLYVKGEQIQVSQPQGDLGCCYSSDGSVKYENHTKDQCTLRNSDYIFTADLCNNIKILPSNILNNASLQNYKTVYYLGLTYSPEAIFTATVSKNSNSETKNLNLSVQTDNSNNLIRGNRIFLKSNTLYQFNQIENSNENSLIRFSLNDTNLIPVINNIFGVVTEDRTNSIQFVKFAPGTSTLYIFLEGQSIPTSYMITVS